MSPRTLYDKIWDEHLVATRADGTSLIYIDRHLVHEVTSPQAFEGLVLAGRALRRPAQILSVADHNVPTRDREKGIADETCRLQVEALEANVKAHGVPYIPLLDDRQGIVHVVGPEQGFTLPGTTVVCGDSHTSTHGAFGALAFGIGTSEVAHVLANQCLLQRRPQTMEIRVNGRLGPGVSAKDIILAVIAKIGIAGGTGHVLEYTGEAIRSLLMEERMTVCNMSIEAGARAGMIAPDDTTFAYLKGRPFAPQGADWDAAVKRWRSLRTDEGAAYDAQVVIDASSLSPMITYGTNPGMGVPVDGAVPALEDVEPAQRPAQEKALQYMGLRPGERLVGKPIDVVFLGSCTNSRISDLRAAATVLRGRKVAPNVRMLVVPGSQQVKQEAEAEGLDRVFREAGAEWREAGCSMCIAMNGDALSAGQYAVSTSNRNFEGRQGKGGRTFLASPVTAAACAVAGAITDVRTLIG